VKRILTRVLILASFLVITGCFNGGYAPVIQAGVAPRHAPAMYRVKRGDTLYSIAWTYGLDYRQLAEINHLSKGYRIWPGQALRLKQRVSSYSWRAHKKSSKKLQHKITNNKSFKLRWGWPAKGKIIQGFKPGYARNAGLDIHGYPGESVRAAARGVVVYSGDGVRGYGNLIIIKHSDDYLSAYAFNRKNLVRVGSRVRRGQQVAVMGRNNEGTPVLHFEIRHDGNPVNPLHYLG